jgi:adenine-specific DNA-methyltransferase
MRKNATSAESFLWYFLRNRQFGGYKFRRQHPYQGYILDFYCHEQGLVIELDGGGHLDEAQSDYDQERTALLNSNGLRVLRFWNNEVFDQIEAALGVIWEALESKS